jgi:signal peptidase II
VKKSYFLIFPALFIVDQYIKYLFVNGFGVDGECISLTLAYNDGVAFSMFAFLKEYLKYIQLGLISILGIYLLWEKSLFRENIFAFMLLFIGAISNIVDRFNYGAVVDYVYWHCGFDFAIFNLSDVFIDIAVVLILWGEFRKSKREKELN